MFQLFAIAKYDDSIWECWEVCLLLFGFFRASELHIAWWYFRIGQHHNVSEEHTVKWSHNRFLPLISGTGQIFKNSLFICLFPIFLSILCLSPDCKDAKSAVMFPALFSSFTKRGTGQGHHWNNNVVRVARSICSLMTICTFLLFCIWRPNWHVMFCNRIIVWIWIRIRINKDYAFCCMSFGWSRCPAQVVWQPLPVFGLTGSLYTI